jgi:hypothetical protein
MNVPTSNICDRRIADVLRKARKYIAVVRLRVRTEITTPGQPILLKCLIPGQGRNGKFYGHGDTFFGSTH